MQLSIKHCLQECKDLSCFNVLFDYLLRIIKVYTILLSLLIFIMGQNQIYCQFSSTAETILLW